MAIVQRIRNKLKSMSKAGPFDCPVCGKKNVGMYTLPFMYIGELQRHGHIHNLFLYETFNMEHYSCKNCTARDRERLYVLYLNEYLKGRQSVDLLDIAPSSTLAHYLKKQPNIRYRSTDLYMDNVDDKLDITDMHAYRDGQFDFFICSHVLEHVPDDKKAMAELYRILKPGGKGIVMVPMNTGVEATLEDPTCTDVATRWKLYGQDDHIRIYAKKDFIARLQNAGFRVHQLGVDHFGAETFRKTAILPNSVLYVVEK